MAGLTHDSGDGGQEQPSAEVTLVRPLFVLTPPTTARHAVRRRAPERRAPRGWAGLVATTGSRSVGGAPDPPASGRITGRRGNDRSRRRITVLAAGTATAAVVVAGLALVVLGPGDGRTAEHTANQPGPAIDQALTDPTTPAGVASAQPSDPGTSPSATVGGGEPAPSPSRIPVRSTSTRTTSSPRAAAFTAVAGESCPESSEQGTRISGFHSDWYTRSSGGWRSDGCGGRVVAVPMSGSTTRDDPDNVIVWWFRTGAVRSGDCSVGVYVPDTGNPKDAAGKPAHYLVRAGTDTDGDVIGQFDVNQSANQGRWVDAGSYGVTTGELSIQMVTRGIDFGSGRDGDHLGVSALRVSCQAH
ncbi:hypothetical protein [Actinoplanes regularis]|uniref:Uncharacterized protein n=1 Tax=Actinoplanes regularis TaxID=52697 RepID=A0A239IIE2_9ACTN|nr:hypothetical protein [Actinoplanes regularis]GIE91525.1 hypothetical protein Are01nite_80050 [Actinoplanes regularis]SNS93420.1 hypothetical protein SAMN06264365_12940 [Actinoplanes regularis]